MDQVNEAIHWYNQLPWWVPILAAFVVVIFVVRLAFGLVKGVVGRVIGMGFALGGGATVWAWLQGVISQGSQLIKR